jgi:hypothetical protein
MCKRASVSMMENRIINAAFAAPLNRVSLLWPEPFAVIAPRLRCSASRFRCYRITAKTSDKLLIKNDNISNKSAEKQPEKKSFAVLSLFRRDNRESGSLEHRIPRQGFLRGRPSLVDPGAYRRRAGQGASFCARIRGPHPARGAAAPA